MTSRTVDGKKEKKREKKNDVNIGLRTTEKKRQKAREGDCS